MGIADVPVTTALLVRVASVLTPNKNRFEFYDLNKSNRRLPA